jgi:hypothetical protein
VNVSADWNEKKSFGFKMTLMLIIPTKRSFYYYYFISIWN